MSLRYKDRSDEEDEELNDLIALQKTTESSFNLWVR